MRRFFSRYRTTLVGFLVLATPLALLWYHGKRREHTTVYERVLVRMTSPAQTTMSDVIGAIHMVWSDYIWLVGVQEQNYDLTRRNEELEAKLRKLDQLRKENRRLKALMRFKGERPDLVTIAARVVAKDVSPFHRVLKVKISAGANHGVRRYQAVVTPIRAVVGHVEKTVGEYAEVKLSVDSGSRISVNVADQDLKGILVGSGDKNTYQASFETSDPDRRVKAGDVLVTNGEDERFPKGLVVGRVDTQEPVAEEGGLRYQVLPAVNFGSLEYVLVVTSQVERIPSMEDER